MSEITRPQRWLEWRNIDATAVPTCPAFGCIEIVGFEFVGRKVVLQGRSATCFDRNPEWWGVYPGYAIIFSDTNQGAQWNHAFNNHISVAPGAIGLCTFDLPTWAAVVTTVVPTFGHVLSMGKYLEIPVGIAPTARTIGSPWKLGIAGPGPITAYLITDEAGWNNYHFDTNYQTETGLGRCFVGGARTFVRAANRSFG